MIELIIFVDGLDVVYERNGEIKIIVKFLVWLNGVSYLDGEG